MPGWIDGGYPGVMPLVVQRRGRQGTDRVLQRRKTGTCLRRLTIPPPADRLFKRRPFPVGAERDAELTRCALPSQAPLVFCQQPSAHRGANPNQVPAARSFRILLRFSSFITAQL